MMREPSISRSVHGDQGSAHRLIVFLVGTFPATWLLMLFLGNVHENVSYWGALPLGVLVSVLLGGVTAQFDMGRSSESL